MIMPAIIAGQIDCRRPAGAGGRRVLVSEYCKAAPPGNASSVLLLFQEKIAEARQLLRLRHPVEYRHFPQTDWAESLHLEVGEAHREDGIATRWIMSEMPDLLD